MPGTRHLYSWTVFKWCSECNRWMWKSDRTTNLSSVWLVDKGQLHIILQNGCSHSEYVFESNSHCYYSMEYWRNWWHIQHIFDVRLLNGQAIAKVAMVPTIWKQDHSKSDIFVQHDGSNLSKFKMSKTIYKLTSFNPLKIWMHRDFRSPL